MISDTVLLSSGRLVELFQIRLRNVCLLVSSMSLSFGIRVCDCRSRYDLTRIHKKKTIRDTCQRGVFTMANGIEVSLKEVYIQIPREVLELAFQPRQRGLTLDRCIQDDVIIPKVLYDCNIVAGRQATIILKPEWVVEALLPSEYYTYQGTTYCIYKIPPDAREHRPISECISISYPGYLYGYMPNGVNTIPNGAMSGMTNNVGSVACELLGSFNGSGVAAPTPIRLNGHMVKLYPITMGFAQNVNWVLTCKLAYDKEFTNLTHRALRPLALLSVTAVKAFIYTKLVVQMDRAFLEGGSELGSIRDIVNGYSDAIREYEEQLRRFHGTSTMLDPELAYRRLWHYL